MFIYPMIALSMAAVTIPWIPLGIILHMGNTKPERDYKRK